MTQIPPPPAAASSSLPQCPAWLRPDCCELYRQEFVLTSGNCLAVQDRVGLLRVGITMARQVTRRFPDALFLEMGVHEGKDLVRMATINGQELLWTASARHRLQWCWQEVHTHRPYIDEVVGQPEHITATTKNYHSGKITRNARGAGRKKTRHYVDNDDDNGPHQHDSIFSVLKSLASTHAESLRQLAWLHQSQCDV